MILSCIFNHSQNIQLKIVTIIFVTLHPDKMQIYTSTCYTIFIIKLYLKLIVGTKFNRTKLKLNYYNIQFQI